MVACRVANGPSTTMTESPTPKSANSTLGALAFCCGEAAELVRVERIDRIVASRNYLDVFVDGEPRRLRGTLDSMQGRLNPASFVRVNRSTLVRLDAIRQIQPWPDGEHRLLLIDGSRVTWTRRYLANLPPGLSLS